MLIITDKHILIEEMRAIDRRKDAVSKGIIPSANSNWNASRNNPKIQNKAKTFANDLSIVNSDLTKGNTFSKQKEYSGSVGPKGNISTVNYLGDRESTDINKTASSSFHKHPIVDKTRAPEGIDPLYFNVPSRPSGSRNEFGDKDAYSVLRKINKTPSRYDYIGSPDSRLQNTSIIRTTFPIT